MGNGYTEQDLEVSKAIGGLTQAVSNMDTKLDGYCRMNEEHHKAIWNKLDSHGKWINRMKGGLTVVGAVISYGFVWVKSKIGIN